MLGMSDVKVRISERDEQVFEIAVIRGKDAHLQGRAYGATTPQQAFAWAQRILPTSVLADAAWEFRSEAGVYVDLDVRKLGWA